MSLWGLKRERGHSKSGSVQRTQNMSLGLYFRVHIQRHGLRLILRIAHHYTNAWKHGQGSLQITDCPVVSRGPCRAKIVSLERNKTKDFLSRAARHQPLSSLDLPEPHEWVDEHACPNHWRWGQQQLWKWLWTLWRQLRPEELDKKTSSCWQGAKFSFKKADGAALDGTPNRHAALLDQADGVESGWASAGTSCKS